MIFKSRLTAPSSKPVPVPTVNAEVEAPSGNSSRSAGEEEACGEAGALGSPVEAADTGVAAAKEEACGETCAQGEAVEAAFDDPET